MQRIKQLDPAVARKIAAGEVIEKPASVLRELLDNAIDSGATEIEIKIREGGLKEIIVSDNGCGMGKEDLSNSILPHTTSKIKTTEDLDNLSTLGFRGEALSSIAACSRVTITSKEREKKTAYRIFCENGNVIDENRTSAPNGTSISVKDIFYSIPARKKFMKSIKGESTSCYNLFMDKAVAFPKIAFRYFNEDKLKIFLPISTALERVQLLYKKRIETILLKEENGINEGPAKIKLVLTTPSTWRRDRKQIQIFINKRRIYEFTLIQAVEYGYSELLPGGCFPSCFLFIEIDPAQVDFNIHPAKREVKIKEVQPLRHQVIDSIKRFLSTYREGNRYVAAAARIENLMNLKIPEKENSPLFYKMKESTSSSAEPKFVNINLAKNYRIPPEITQRDQAPTSYNKNRSTNTKKNLTESKNSFREPNNQNLSSEIKYIYTFQKLFILVEKNKTLYLIDQHAAHERILFDKYTQQKEGQKLLIPAPLIFDDYEDPNSTRIKITQTKIESLKKCGIELKFDDKKGWLITAIPSTFSKSVEIIAQMIPNLPENIFELQKKLFATISCRSAIKAGDDINTSFAEELAINAFKLPEPTCPHGRPVYFSLTLEELCHLVGRDAIPPSYSSN